MQVPDALSRWDVGVSDENGNTDENDPHFPYIAEQIGNIKLPDRKQLHEIISLKSSWRWYMPAYINLTSFRNISWVPLGGDGRIEE